MRQTLRGGIKMRPCRTFPEVLLQCNHAAVLPQLCALLVELHRWQHADVQLLAQRLRLVPLRLHPGADALETDAEVMTVYHGSRWPVTNSTR